MLNTLGIFATLQENYDQAEGYFDQGLRMAREIDHRSGATSTLNNLGHLHILLGEDQAALEYLREALMESLAIGAVPLTLESLVGVAQQKIEVGQYVSAAELLSLIMSHPALEIDVRQVAELALDRLHKVLPTEQLEATMERGKKLELNAVITALEAEVAEILGNQ